MLIVEWPVFLLWLAGAGCSILNKYIQLSDKTAAFCTVCDIV